MEPPKVFLSHAGEDKQRFVIEFAQSLRGKGVDVWLDIWEMNPGDSLIDKIFSEGIKDAEAFIVVLSKHSIDKHWVREELNAGMVNKIAGKTKIIPIVLDNVEVPESLKATIYQIIEDLNNYSTELQKILDAIFDHYEKPPIGSPPRYTEERDSTVTGLSSVESLIFKIIVEYCIKANSRIVSPQELMEDMKSQDISSSMALEAIEVLSFNKLIETKRLVNGYPFSIKVTTHGFTKYAQHYIQDYNSLEKEIASQIINYDKKGSYEIAAAIDQPHKLVWLVMDSLQAKGYFNMTTLVNGVGIIPGYSPALKKILMS